MVASGFRSIAAVAPAITDSDQHAAAQSDQHFHADCNTSTQRSKIGDRQRAKCG